MLNDKECFVCARRDQLECHHIFMGGLRKFSERYGLKVWLCHEHHNENKRGDAGVHFNRELDLRLKVLAQTEFEKTHTREEFMSLAGRNYL